jgi:1-acyl-sn-glycerol-3-phosphate acyltransferase
VSATAAKLSPFSRLVLWLLLALYRRQHWHVAGGPPAARKFVVIGAPHTSNWDFVVFLGATRELGIRARFLGKHTLFRWPLARFMREIGGIAVNRRARGGNYVEQVVAEFERRSDLALVIAPEGTRGPIGKWRSGFYHIALEAKVPVVPAWLDRATHRAMVGPAIDLTGDYARDLRIIAEFYHASMPDHPKLAALYREAGLA